MYQDKNPKLTTYTYEGECSKIEMGTPLELKDSPPQNLGELESYVVKYFDKQGLGKNAIRIVLFSYDKETIERQTGEEFVPNLDGAAQGFIDDFKNNPNYKKLTNGPLKYAIIDGVEGREFSVAYTYEGNNGSETNVEGTVIVLIKDMDLWMITLMDRKGDDVSKSISNKIRETIKIK